MLEVHRIPGSTQGVILRIPIDGITPLILIYQQVPLYIMALTTIKITTETRDALRAIGQKGDTYDTVITRLFAAIGLDVPTLANVTNIELPDKKGLNKEMARFVALFAPIDLE